MYPGSLPEPYVHQWAIIFPRPVQQPTQVRCKARMLLYLLREGYITPADVLARLRRLPASGREAQSPAPADTDCPPAAATLTGATVMLPFHKELAAGRWFTLTYAEQLGNLGSEVERTIRAVETGEPERKERAFARALELLDLTLKDPRRAGKQAELLRLRETLCDVFQGENTAGTTFESLRRYFLEWGLMARAGR